MKEIFGMWIIEELQKRNWSQADFARRSDLGTSTISRVLSGAANPGLDFLQGTARAFGMPLDAVMRRAGVLPDQGEVLAEAREWSARLRALTPEQREAVIRTVDNVLRVAEGLPARAGRS